METKKIITKTRANALRIVKNLKNAKPEAFARLMWSDSLKWNRRSGNGVLGHGMVLSAGSYLSKLEKEGLVERKFVKNSDLVVYSITQLGLAELRIYEVSKRFSSFDNGTDW